MKAQHVDRSIDRTPDLTPAARTLAREFLYMEGRFSEPMKDVVMQELKQLCVAHHKLQFNGDAEKMGEQMAYGLLAELEREQLEYISNVVPLPPRGRK